MLLTVFQIERLDIVYDCKSEHRPRYIDDGAAMLVGREMPWGAMRTFIRPKLGDVRDFVLDVF